MNKKELKEVLDNHLHWINKDCENWENLRADLRAKDLRIEDLHCANLCYAYLRDADINDADLHGANLIGADLSGANLIGADLRDANLRHASLYEADLYKADLRGADLRGADLRHAYLNGANLSEAKLWGADLLGAILYDVKGQNLEYRRGKVVTQDIIGYKKCAFGIIVTLLIPRGSIVFSINGNKCRTNKAKVIAIDGSDRAFSSYNCMSYYVGDEFTVYNFNCQYNEECAEGIHFFMTKQEAESYGR